MSNYWKPCGIIPVSSIAMPFSAVVVTDLQSSPQFGQQGSMARSLENLYNDALQYGTAAVKTSYKPKYATYYEQLKAEIKDWLK